MAARSQMPCRRFMSAAHERSEMCSPFHAMVIFFLAASTGRCRSKPACAAAMKPRTSETSPGGAPQQQSKYTLRAGSRGKSARQLWNSDEKGWALLSHPSIPSSAIAAPMCVASHQSLNFVEVQLKKSLPYGIAEGLGGRPQLGLEW